MIYNLSYCHFEKLNYWLKRLFHFHCHILWMSFTIFEAVTKKPLASLKSFGLGHIPSGHLLVPCCSSGLLCGWVERLWLLSGGLQCSWPWHLTANVKVLSNWPKVKRCTYSYVYICIYLQNIHCNSPICIYSFTGFYYIHLHTIVCAINISFSTCINIHMRMYVEPHRSHSTLKAGCLLRDAAIKSWYQTFFTYKPWNLPCVPFTLLPYSVCRFNYMSYIYIFIYIYIYTHIMIFVHKYIYNEYHLYGYDAIYIYIFFFFRVLENTHLILQIRLKNEIGRSRWGRWPYI